MGRPTAECIEIDHPWISNDVMPLYRWTFPSEATNEELNACFRARDDWAIRVRHHFAWVVDLSNITKAPATQRKALAEHLRSYEEFSERWNAGSALIVPSAWPLGLTFHNQFSVLDPRMNAMGFVFSNGGTGKVGNR